MKRRTIRTFFIGLLLLCVGGWWLSYVDCWEIGYAHNKFSHEWTDIQSGKVYLMWENIKQVKVGWEARRHKPWDHENRGDPSARRFHLLGFSNVRVHSDLEGIPPLPDAEFPVGNLGLPEWSIFELGIPFWFPTITSAALLLLVWRKTRLPVKGRAFPVELSKPNGGS